MNVQRYPILIGALALVAVARGARPQNPLTRAVDGVQLRYARSQPMVWYRLQVDSSDLSGVDVELHFRDAPDTFQIAMFAHPEYDDRYWRFIAGLRVDSSGAGASVTRLDSAVWRVAAPGGRGIVRYRLQLPPSPTPRAAWRPVLTANGGLVGGPHSFLYIVGATRAPVFVRLDLPRPWDVATGLEPTADPRVFFAPTTDVLVDSPILIGHLRSWRFEVDAVPHHVVYWSPGEASSFDTAAFVAGIERVARQATALFGRAPYRDYTFLIEDGAYGALEHANSVTIGAPSGDLAGRPDAVLPEIAHEYFHTWNLVRIRPEEYREVDYRPPTPSPGLWWSEGATMFYADLLARRAGVRAFGATRIEHLEQLIARYYAYSGNVRLSPEQVSRAAYATRPDVLGDYSASTHLQGELLTTMLDLLVRDATDGHRTMDDVMRAMLDRYSGARGFTNTDIEHTVADVCRCGVQDFFDRYVRHGGGIAFNAFFRLAGLRLTVDSQPVLDSGRASPDLRIRAWLPPGESRLRLLPDEPATIWGRAGLHAGDQLIALDEVDIASPADFRTHIRALRVGDRVVLDVTAPDGSRARRVVTVAGYPRPVAHIVPIPQATQRQLTLRARWLEGTP